MSVSHMSRLIRFRCKCGKKLKAPTDIIGRKVRCTRCPKIHTVPPQDSLDAIRPKPKAPGPQVATRPPDVVSPDFQPSKNALAAEQDVKSSPSQKNVELLVEDNSPNSQTSMLPTGSDGSDERFKLDPDFDPQPVDEIVGPDGSTNDFDIDIDFSSLNVEKIAPTHSPTPKQRLATKTPVKRTAKHSPSLSNGNPFPIRKLIVAVGGVAAAMLVGVVGYWLFAGGSGFPAAFESRPEVKNYIATADQFRKSERTLLLVSEAYIKSKAPAEAEVDQIQQFNQSVAPLANKDATLKEALELFKAFQPEKARTTLVTATQEMSSKIPQMEAKAKNYTQKLR